MIQSAEPSILFAEVAPLTASEFERLQRIVHQHFGYDLRPGKEELVSARLNRKIGSMGLKSFTEYLDFITSAGNDSHFSEMIDLLTTNFTSFFREQPHFNFFTAILPMLRRQGTVRIWSAACSSGEEPYSIAIAAAENGGLTNVEILATDISTRVLKKAKAGVFPAQAVQNVPQAVLRRYFLKGEGQTSGYFRVKPEIANRIQFARLNLAQPFSHKHLFSLIWCRNVMIYFNKATQEAVVNKLARCLESGGYLFIGHSEALGGVQQPLRYVEPAIYRR
jgi:chemotaxis protein methyltransferase CheR